MSERKEDVRSPETGGFDTLEGCQRDLARVVEERNRMAAALSTIANLTEKTKYSYTVRRKRINELAVEALRKAAE